MVLFLRGARTSIVWCRDSLRKVKKGLIFGHFSFKLRAIDNMKHETLVYARQSNHQQFIEFYVHSMSELRY